MTPKLALVKSGAQDPMAAAHVLQDQLRALSTDAVTAALGRVDSLHEELSDLLRLELKPGVRQALERMQRAIRQESLQASSLLEKRS